MAQVRPLAPASPPDRSRRSRQPDPPPPGVDPARPSPARLYDYYLGGVNNFEVDRAAADRIGSQMPELRDAAWANRGFHQRAARWLAENAGIRQFIDIGSGLPAQGHTEHGYARTRAEVERFFEGLELVPPFAGAGPRVAFAGEWGAVDPGLADSGGSRSSYCAVARCP